MSTVKKGHFDMPKHSNKRKRKNGTGDLYNRVYMRSRREQGKDTARHLLEQTVYLLNKEIAPDYRLLSCQQFIFAWEWLRDFAALAVKNFEIFSDILMHWPLLKILVRTCFDDNGKLVDGGPHLITNTVFGEKGQILSPLHELCVIRGIQSNIHYKENTYLCSHISALHLPTLSLLDKKERSIWEFIYERGKLHELHYTYDYGKEGYIPPIKEIFRMPFGLVKTAEILEEFITKSMSLSPKLQGIIVHHVVPDSYEEWESLKRRGKRVSLYK